MSCPTTTELADFLAGRLAEPELEQVACHLEACAECQHLLDELPETDDQGLKALSHLGEEPLLSSVCGEMIARVLGDPGKRGVEQPPSEIRDYVLGSQLGRGGMGVVYEATHQRLKRPVAIKLLRSRHAKQGAVARFQREMEAIGRVEHDNIVRALDAGEAEGFEFLVMERIHGLNLREIVESSGNLRPPDACEVVRQAACGLSHAHELNLIHRDVKPSNLMLSTDGTVKLLDLGLALIAEHPREDESVEAAVAEPAVRPRDDTTTGAVIGSAGYMSPEQAENSHHVDYRTDIYSLGRTLCFLLTGQPPTADIETVGQLPKDLEPKLVRLLEQMTARAPEHRPQTAGEIAYRLSHLSREADLSSLVEGAAAGNGLSTRVRWTHGGLRHGAPAAAGQRRWIGGLVLLILFAVGVMVWRTGVRPPARDLSNASNQANSVEPSEAGPAPSPAPAQFAPAVSITESLPASTQTDAAGARETATAFDTKQGLAISVTRQQEDEITTHVLTGDEAQQYVKQRPMLNMQLLYRQKPMFVMVTEVKTEKARVRVERAVGFFTRARIWEGASSDEPTYAFDGQNLNELMLRDDAWCRKYLSELLGQAPLDGSVSRGTVQLQATGHRTMMLTDTTGFSIRIMEQLGGIDEPQSGVLVDAGPEPLTNVRATTREELREQYPHAARLYDQTLKFFGDTIDEMAQPTSPNDKLFE